MKKYVLLLFSIFYFSSLSQSNSQVHLEWARTLNSITTNDLSAMVIDDQENVYVTGHSADFGIATIKYNSEGDTLWLRKSFFSSGHDYGRAIALDNLNNVYVIGYIPDSLILIKYNSQGDSQWVSTFNSTNNVFRPDCWISLDKLGDILVGTTTNFGYNDDFLFLKYNSSGQLIKTTRYDGPNSSDDELYDMKADSGGNIYVTGMSRYPNGLYWLITAKYDSNLDSVWVSRSNVNYTTGEAITIDDSNIYVAGSFYSGQTATIYYTVKYDAMGQQKWERTFNANIGGNEDADAIAVDKSGNVYVTGGANFYRFDYLTIKYSSSGVLQWSRRYDSGGSTEDIANSIAIDSSQNIYITGGNAFLTVKYDPDGDTLWAERYSLSSNIQVAKKILVSKTGNVYVAGSSAGWPNTAYSYLTIKYSQPLGIQNNGNLLPNSFSLSQNYPNPFNPTATIKYELPKDVKVLIKVYDILGTEVKKLVDEFKKAGNYTVDFDGTNLASGVFFYRIEAGDYVMSKKMVLVK